MELQLPKKHSFFTGAINWLVMKEDPQPDPAPARRPYGKPQITSELDLDIIPSCWLDSQASPRAK